MSDPLYSLEVLRLAAEAKGAGRLTEPQGTGSEYNPACGDRSTVDLDIENGAIAAIAHETGPAYWPRPRPRILAALPGCSYARPFEAEG